MKNHHQGWRRLISAANYSKQGFVSSWHSEAAIRQELMALLVLLVKRHPNLPPRSLVDYHPLHFHGTTMFSNHPVT